MSLSLQKEDRLKAMLKDLGKSTLRGIRRCYKCGTLNGTRGLSCKNKACDVVFTEAGRKKKQSMEVCKLHTGSSPQVFSVRVREKGPDFRGFVQLPAVQSNLEEHDPADLSYPSPVTALCFVESCQRLFNTNILKCHERGLVQPTTSCQHIQSALRCCSDATVLSIDYKTLQLLNTTQYIKDNIWETETSTGSTVQRVSKTIMAVKCKETTKHPLGFLHISFLTPSKCKDKVAHFSCTCSTFKNAKATDPSRNCIHYYACVAAFASDSKLAAEFALYVVKERVPEEIVMDPNVDDCRLIEIFNTTMNQNEGESLSKEDDNNFILSDLPTVLDGLTSIVDVTSDLDTGLDPQSPLPVIARINESTTTLIKTVKPRRKKANSVPGILKKKEKQPKMDVIPQQLPFSQEAPDPNSVSLSYFSWLASVTERINQTMHAQVNGNPEPLVFNVPHAFFDCLMERFMNISFGGNKRKRLPNYITTVVRKSSPPIGTFYNYTWHINSLAHAKAIFDSPLMSLSTSRSFVQKADGTYDEVDPATLEEGLSRREGERSIRPVEVKTFLKIGSSENEPPSFMAISWTPSVLPVSKIGELTITFEFGHSNRPDL